MITTPIQRNMNSHEQRERELAKLTQLDGDFRKMAFGGRRMRRMAAIVYGKWAGSGWPLEYETVDGACCPGCEQMTARYRYWQAIEDGDCVDKWAMVCDMCMLREGDPNDELDSQDAATRTASDAYVTAQTEALERDLWSSVPQNWISLAAEASLYRIGLLIDSRFAELEHKMAGEYLARLKKRGAPQHLLDDAADRFDRAEVNLCACEGTYEHYECRPLELYGPKTWVDRHGVPFKVSLTFQASPLRMTASYINSGEERPRPTYARSFERVIGHPVYRLWGKTPRIAL